MAIRDCQSKRVLSACIFITLLLGAVVCHSAPAPKRAALGLLSFQSASRADTGVAWALPALIGWEAWYVPGLDVTDVHSLHMCLHLDRIYRPRTLSDAPGHSRLARALGVDYLATGRVERSDGDRLRLRIVVFSASSSHPVYTRTTVVSHSDLLRVSARAAREIAKSLGVTAGAVPARPYTSRDSVDAFGTMVRLESLPDADVSDLAAAERAAGSIADQPGIGVAARVLSAGPRGWFMDVARMLERARRDAPGNMLVLREIVTGYCEIGAERRARPYAAEWLRLDPHSLAARSAAVATGRVSPGDHRLEQAELASSAERPWRVQLSVARFLSFARVGDIRDARTCLGELKRRLPRSAYIRAVAGQTLSRRGRHADGAGDFREAVKLNPDSFRLRVLLAHAYLGAGDADQALLCLKTVLRRWPGKTEGHLLAARIYFRKGMRKQGLAELETARKLDPDLDMDSRFLASEYVRSGRLIEALRELALHDPAVRTRIIWISAGLMVVFLGAVVGIALIVRAATRRDGRPNTP